MSLLFFGIYGLGCTFIYGDFNGASVVAERDP